MPSAHLSNYGIVEVTAATLSLTAAAHAGQKVVSNLAATQTFTLPAATGSGNVYEIIVETTKTGDLVIQVASASDTMDGVAWLGNDSAGASCFYTAAASDTVTLDGSTTGGIAGAIVKLTDYASGKWLVRVDSEASGTEATPFSAAVS